LEGLEFGWKKSITRYHFFEKDCTYSICAQANSYKSELKSDEFLSEVEFTADMIICQECYSMRKDDIKHRIIQYHKESVGFWDDSAVCPKCKTPVMFFNHTKTHEHLCTVCDEMVVIP